jgi:hypothetical protein
MLIEHLARYADKDTTNRGKAGYWSARDSERAAKFPKRARFMTLLIIATARTGTVISLRKD